MAKNVKRIILSEKLPRNKHIAWAKPEGDNINLKIFEDNKWKPVAGSGNSSSDSSGCGCNDFEIELTGDNPNNINGANINKGNFQDVYSKITNGQLVNGKVFYKTERDNIVVLVFNEIQYITAGINPNNNKPGIMIVIYSVDGNKIGNILWTEDSVVFINPSASGGQLG